MILQSDQLYLLSANEQSLKAAIDGHEALSQYLNLQVDPEFTIFGIEPLKYVLDRISKYPEEALWWTYFVIHSKDMKVIGTCGYKGKPMLSKSVEIGYEIAPSFQRQGLGLLTAQLLIENAFSQPDISEVMAHTLAEKNPSVRILEKLNFKHIATINDPDDGNIWQWQLTRNP